MPTTSTSPSLLWSVPLLLKIQYHWIYNLHIKTAVGIMQLCISPESNHALSTWTISRPLSLSLHHVSYNGVLEFYSHGCKCHTALPLLPVVHAHDTWFNKPTSCLRIMKLISFAKDHVPSGDLTQLQYSRCLKMTILKHWRCKIHQRDMWKIKA